MAPLKNTLNMNVGLCHNSPCAGIRDSYYNGLVLNLMVINENEKSWSHTVKFNKKIHSCWKTTSHLENQWHQGDGNAQSAIYIKLIQIHKVWIYVRIPKRLLVFHVLILISKCFVKINAWFPPIFISLLNTISGHWLNWFF